jgi:hypothetical protein
MHSHGGPWERDNNNFTRSKNKMMRSQFTIATKVVHAITILACCLSICATAYTATDAKEVKPPGYQKYQPFDVVAIHESKVYGPAAGKKMKIFIMSGQSNMVGQGASAKLPEKLQRGNDRVLMFENGRWQPLRPLSERFGPEIAFGDAMGKAWPNETIGIVKQAVGGTSVLAWQPDWTKESADRAKDGKKGNLWLALTNKVRDAIATTDYELCGFVWLQGGKDMQSVELAKEYAANLERFVKALRAKFNKPNLPMMLGTYRDDGMPENIDFSNIDPSTLATQRPGAFYVIKAQQEAEDYLKPANAVPLRNLERHPADVHYNTKGQMDLGKLFAKGYLELLKEIDK